MVIGSRETENEGDGRGFCGKTRKREEMMRTGDLQKITFSRKCKDASKKKNCCVFS